MTWIQTLDDRKFDLVNPTRGMIDADVICRVLARIPRFGGHTRDFYSVAQHSLLVESLCHHKDLQVRLAFLLHDAHEVYSGFGDVCRPAKNLTPGVKEGIGDCEWRINRAIAEYFDFPTYLFTLDSLREADAIALATESRDLMGPPPEPWESLPPPSPVLIVEPYCENEAYVRFSARLFELWANHNH